MLEEPVILLTGLFGHDSSLSQAAAAAAWGCLDNRPTCSAVDSWLGWIDICGQNDTSSPLCRTKCPGFPQQRGCVTTLEKNEDGTMSKANTRMARSRTLCLSNKHGGRANERAVSPLTGCTAEFYRDQRSGRKKPLLLLLMGLHNQDKWWPAMLPVCLFLDVKLILTNGIAGPVSKGSTRYHSYSI